MTLTTVDTARVSIRAAHGRDLEAIESLLTSSQLPVDGVRDALPGFLVAEAAGRIVGVVGLERCGKYGLLRSTAVSPEWRGKHVARELVERIIATAESQGINALYLLTTTAERYFPMFGFAQVSREAAPEAIQATQEFREACPSTATCMSLSLSGPRP